MPIQLSVLCPDRFCAEALAVFEIDPGLAQTMLFLELAGGDVPGRLDNLEDFVLDRREFKLLLFPLGVRENFCLAVRASKSVTANAL